ncbi:hypothetical protein PCE1_004330 [Barthelona sp. PCE]
MDEIRDDDLMDFLASQKDLNVYELEDGSFVVDTEFSELDDRQIVTPITQNPVEMKEEIEEGPFRDVLVLLKTNPSDIKQVRNRAEKWILRHVDSVMDARFKLWHEEEVRNIVQSASVTKAIALALKDPMVSTPLFESEQLAPMSDVVIDEFKRHLGLAKLADQSCYEFLMNLEQSLNKNNAKENIYYEYLHFFYLFLNNSYDRHKMVFYVSCRQALLKFLDKTVNGADFQKLSHRLTLRQQKAFLKRVFKRRPDIQNSIATSSFAYTGIELLSQAMLLYANNQPDTLEKTSEALKYDTPQVYTSPKDYENSKSGFKSSQSFASRLHRAVIDKRSPQEDVVSKDVSTVKTVDPPRSSLYTVQTGEFSPKKDVTDITVDTESVIESDTESEGESIVQKLHKRVVELAYEYANVILQSVTVPEALYDQLLSVFSHMIMRSTENALQKLVRHFSISILNSKSVNELAFTLISSHEVRMYVETRAALLIALSVED